MPDRYPGYDVLSKRHSPSWNEATRRVIDERLAIPREPRFFDEAEWRTLNAVCGRIVPQPKDRPPIPVAAMVDAKMTTDSTDGYRNAQLPKMQAAWRRGLAALDAEARSRFGTDFHGISQARQDTLLANMQRGELVHPAWGGMPSQLFFTDRVLHDVVAAYYAHPTAWSEIGFGGPASPRGYVRMGFDKRDPWEAAEARPGQRDEASRKNRNVA